MASLTVIQALALIQQEIAKTTGANKNAANRNASNLSIQIGRLGIGGNEVLSLPEPPPPSGRRSRKPSKPKAGKRNAPSTTGRRN